MNPGGTLASRGEPMALIKPLGECPDYAPVLAYWSYNLWYRSRPSATT